MKFLSGKVGAKLKVNWIEIICNRFDLPRQAISILNVESLKWEKGSLIFGGKFNEFSSVKKSYYNDPNECILVSPQQSMYKDTKPAAEEGPIHRIRITLTSRNVKSLEKVNLQLPASNDFRRARFLVKSQSVVVGSVR